MALSCVTLQDRVALAEIERLGELIIAAADAGDGRLSPARIDEVLGVGGPHRIPGQGARRDK